MSERMTVARVFAWLQAAALTGMDRNAHILHLFDSIEEHHAEEKKARKAHVKQAAADQAAALRVLREVRNGLAKAYEIARGNPPTHREHQQMIEMTVKIKNRVDRIEAAVQNMDTASQRLENALLRRMARDERPDVCSCQCGKRKES